MSDEPPDSGNTPVSEWAQLRARSAQLTSVLTDFACDCRMKAAKPGVQPLARIGLARNATRAEKLASQIERHARRSESWADKSEGAMRGEQNALRDPWMKLIRKAEQLLRGWDP